jgi:integrase
MPTFHEYASKWLEHKKAGLLGDRPIGTNTEADYRSRLANHILPFFGEYRVNEITTGDCLEFKAHKLKESAELQRSLEAGAELRDRRGRRVRPLGPATLRKLIACLTSILDEAVSDGYLPRNPARTRRMRIKVPKPRRTFLEMDELVALTDAAAEQDASVARARLPVTPKPGTTAANVAERWAAGMRAIHIAADLGISRPTVTYHLRRMRYEDPGVYEGRRAIVATLGGSGVRVSELCNTASATSDYTRPAAPTFGFQTPRPKPASAKCRSARTCSRRSSPTSMRYAESGCRSTATRTSSATGAAVASSARRSTGSSARRPGTHPPSWSLVDFHNSRTPHRTPYVAHTSPSPCWRTASTSSG